MPTINIPPKARFILYLVAALGSVLVIYTMDRGWAGEAEYKLWTGIAGLLNLLAAMKVSTNDSGVVIAGTVEQTTTTTTEIDPDEMANDERGATNAELAFFMGIFAVLLLLFILVAF